MWTDTTGEEEEDAYPCCDRPLYEGKGTLMSDNGDLADYAYRWAEGHGIRFTLGICPVNGEGKYYAGVTAVTCHSDGESLIYTVLDPDDSPWDASENMGEVLTRQQVLQEKRIPNLFDLVDAITVHETRIASRIAAPNRD